MGYSLIVAGSQDYVAPPMKLVGAVRGGTVRAASPIEFGRLHSRRGFARRTFSVRLGNRSMPIEFIDDEDYVFFPPSRRKKRKGPPATAADLYFGRVEPGFDQRIKRFRVGLADGGQFVLEVECRGDILREDDGAKSTSVERLVRAGKMSESEAFTRKWAPFAAGKLTGANQRIILTILMSRIEAMAGKRFKQLNATVSSDDLEEVAGRVLRKLANGLRERRLPTHPGKMISYLRDPVGQCVATWLGEQIRRQAREVRHLATRRTPEAAMSPAERIEQSIARMMFDDYRNDVKRLLMAQELDQQLAWRDPARRRDPAQRERRESTVRRMVEELAPRWDRLLDARRATTRAGGRLPTARNLMRGWMIQLRKQLETARWERGDDGFEIPTVEPGFA